MSTIWKCACRPCRIAFDATGSLSRAAWGVKTYEPLIGDKVGLMLSGAFEMSN